ncbi:phage integrase Arm DNA-binding domain-containing protein [Pseudomonas putida]|uniref:Phage integrase Arm DNA-binding domain-containing protein n=1 Tax=Pseudomonas putida TaxID=303 RepID=A0AAW4BUF2_PSEPU|nr:phage integrase Arm DNA-binding domain-containing protein [Pseudomonas putida]MBF8703062.1 phage integrase Arm DNA-binding domain-containing protein [Pseudomonas putida]MBF8736918.1 phage integrase Arm DNA-binding domain-containing protein [Pseudomonas putida]MDZ5111935.1 phage integrase Arm DNA-binding domain-containing protein [Pseudomonas putida]
MAPRPRNPGSKDLPPNLYRKTDKRNGVTYYTYRDPVSNRMFGLGSDKAKAISEAVTANMALQQALPTLASKISPEPKVKDRTFREWVDEYRQVLADRELSASTMRTNHYMLIRLVAAFDDRGMRSITTMDIADFLSGFVKAGKSQMAKGMRSLLRDIFMEAMARGWVDSNPVEATRAARVKVKRQRLTLELWKATYEEAKHPWLKRAMELAILTGQRREDILSFVFKDEVDGFLQVVQAKTGARLRISTSVTLECLGLNLGEVIRRCRDRVISKTLIHHHRTVARAKAGTPLKPDTVSKEFAAARDRAAAKLNLDLGDSPPSFHEQRSLAARLHEEEGRDAQRLLGHRTAKMTDMYLDSRGSAWIDVA